jgi:dTDP-glucose 4,6-dehydratase
MGGGKSVRAFIHARDVARAIFSMIQDGKPGEIYHFSPEFFLSIREVVEKICVKLDTRFEDAIELSAERPAKDQAYLMNAQKAQQELDWTPQISFDEGLTKTIDWISQNFEAFSKMNWNYVHKA